MYLVVGRGSCPFCEKAKQLLTRSDKEFVYIDMAEQDDHEYWKVILRERMNLTQVPQVFELVGGYAQLERKLNGE